MRANVVLFTLSDVKKKFSHSYSYSYEDCRLLNQNQKGNGLFMWSGLRVFICCWILYICLSVGRSIYTYNIYAINHVSCTIWSKGGQGDVESTELQELSVQLLCCTDNSWSSVLSTSPCPLLLHIMHVTWLIAYIYIYIYIYIVLLLRD